MRSLSSGTSLEAQGFSCGEAFILVSCSFGETVGNCGAGLGIQEVEQEGRRHSWLEGQEKDLLVLPAVQWDTSHGPWSTGTTTGDAAWL